MPEVEEGGDGAEELGAVGRPDADEAHGLRRALLRLALYIIIFLYYIIYVILYIYSPMPMRPMASAVRSCDWHYDYIA